MRRIGYAAAADKQKKLIKASIKLQIFSITTVFVVLWFFYSIQLACSAVLGSFCALIPTLTAIRWHFRHVGVQNASKMLAGIYLAEALKFVLIVLLLVVAYALAATNPWFNATGILIGFVVTYLITLLMPLIAK